MRMISNNEVFEKLHDLEIFSLSLNLSYQNICTKNYECDSMIIRQTEERGICTISFALLKRGLENFLVDFVFNKIPNFVSNKETQFIMVQLLQEQKKLIHAFENAGFVVHLILRDHIFVMHEYKTVVSLVYCMEKNNVYN